AGAELLRDQTRRAGAIGLAIVYGIFAIFWLPRLYYVPHFFGFNLPLLIRGLDGLGEQVILIAAAVIVYLQQPTSNQKHKSMLAGCAPVAVGPGRVIFRGG